MKIGIELFINQLSQNIYNMIDGKKWFSEKDDNEQLNILYGISNFIIQAGAKGSDVNVAVLKSKIKKTCTPCVLLLKAENDEPLGNRLLASQLAMVSNLPKDERLKSFELLIQLLGIADKRRKESKCASGCTHWWHKDLKDQSVIDMLIKRL